MKCSTTSALVFLYLCLAFGCAAAGVTQGLKYFTPSLIIFLRMFFGFSICFILLIYKVLTDKYFRKNFKKHLYPGFWGFFHMCGTGIIYQGFPHVLLAFAQNGYVSSTTSQLMQPFSTTMGAIVAHFLLPDEKFNIKKFYSLLTAIIGVVMTAVPSFSHPMGSLTFKEMLIGYILLFIGVSCFGIGTIYIKLRTSSFDVSITSTLQMFSASLFAFIGTLIMEGYQDSLNLLLKAPFMGYFWVSIVGIFSSGLAMYATIYLVEQLGANGVNFASFGQIIVGVVVGVVLMHDWKEYLQWEIFLSIGGILMLGVGILIGFSKNPQDDYKKLQIDSLPEI